MTVSLVLGLIAFWIMRDLALDRSREQLTALALVQEARINEAIEKNKERIKGVSSRTKLRNTLRSLQDMDESEERELALEAVLDIITDARDFITAFREISIIGIDGLVLSSTDGSLLGEDFSTQNCYEKAKKTEHLEFQTFHQKAILCLAGPLQLEGEYLGQVFIHSDPSSIQQILTDYQGMGKTGETVLAQQLDDGSIQFLHPLRFFLESNELILSRQAVQNGAAIFTALAGREEFLLQNVDYRGQEVFAATRYIEDTNWGMVVKLDKKEALQYSNIFLRRFGVFITIIAVLALLFSMLLSSSVSRPLRELREAVQKLEAGKSVLVPHSNRVDEIGDLQRAFRSMAEKILNFRKGIEKKVQERTSELEKTNRLMVDRELKMIELKKELAKLKQANEAKK